MKSRSLSDGQHRSQLIGTLSLGVFLDLTCLVLNVRSCKRRRRGAQDVHQVQVLDAACIDKNGRQLIRRRQSPLSFLIKS